MFGFIIIILITWVLMWAFFKLMYPLPPKHYYPKEGDVLEPRACDYCGHSLEEYRGVLEPKTQSESQDSDNQDSDNQDSDNQDSDNQDSDNQDSQNEESQSQESMSHKSEGLVKTKLADQSEDEDDLGVDAWFFCNYEHQATFHQERGKTDVE